MNDPDENEEFDIERMKAYMALSAEEKLLHLEKLYHFNRAMRPRKNDEIAKQLRDEGF